MNTKDYYPFRKKIFPLTYTFSYSDRKASSLEEIFYGWKNHLPLHNPRKTR